MDTQQGFYVRGFTLLHCCLLQATAFSFDANFALDVTVNFVGESPDVERRLLLCWSNSLGRR